MHSIPNSKPIRQNLIRNLQSDLLRGLTGAWILNETDCKIFMNSARSDTTGAAAMQVVPKWDGSPWGSALRFSSADSDYALIENYTGFRPTTYPFCIAARAKVPASDYGAVIWTNDDTLNKYCGVTLSCTADGYYFILLGDGGAPAEGSRSNFTFDTASVADTWVSVAFNVYSMSSFKGYMDGKEYAGTVSGTGDAIRYSATYGSMGREDISASAGFSYYSNHTAEYIYLWTGRDLSDQDAMDLFIDPYRMFENRSRAMFFVTAPASWGNKINDVSNASISKINGIYKTSISKVNGV